MLKELTALNWILLFRSELSETGELPYSHYYGDP